MSAPALRARRHLSPIRPRLPRRALPWWVAAVGLTVLTGLTVDGALRRAAEAESAYGQTRPVAVAIRSVEAGTAIGAGDVELRAWPVALAPPAALDEVPVGRRALVDLMSGEPVAAGRVSAESGDGPAPLLGPDERALPIPITIPGLDPAVGDRVDLLAGGAPGGGPAGDLPGAPTEPAVVASRARVLAVAEESVVVAVPSATAPEVAAALTSGPVLLALRPPGA